MCVSLLEYLCLTCLWYLERPAKGIWHPGRRVIGDCKLPCGSGNGNQVPHNSCKHSFPPSLPSVPIAHFVRQNAAQAFWYPGQDLTPPCTGTGGEKKSRWGEHQAPTILNVYFLAIFVFVIKNIDCVLNFLVSLYSTHPGFQEQQEWQFRRAGLCWCHGGCQREAANLLACSPRLSPQFWHVQNALWT